jgi:hypothetical protein
VEPHRGGEGRATPAPGRGTSGGGRRRLDFAGEGKVAGKPPPPVEGS